MSTTEERNQEILRLIRSIDREGINDLADWLEESSFFTMPSSARYHSNYDGGLADHSWKVYIALLSLADMYRDMMDDEISPESMILTALCHDVCKIDFYKKDTRNVKNKETGQWEAKEFYTYNDWLGMGHGEASVYLLSRFIKLTEEEALAIRWHMGGFDNAVRGGDRGMDTAAEHYPLVTLLQMADLWASRFMEETRA